MAKSTLPKGILKSDLEAPKWDSEDEVDHACGDFGVLWLNRTERFGWVINTLNISKGRSYGIQVDGDSIVSTGNGPHVLETIRIHLRKSRLEALKPFIDKYADGMARASSVRDRRSSRIAEGQERRARGQRSWMWDN